ncbi:response regulator transcription factor [Paenibacillus timonensis]|nr:response regulator [Paenibacillus timonensis]
MEKVLFPFDIMIIGRFVEEMAMKKILIIADEINSSEDIRLTLESEKYEVEVTVEGRDGLTKALDENTNLIFLMLPSLKGIEVCKQIRAESNTPIIMINSQDNAIDQIIALDSGVDYLLPSVFHFEELLARMRAIIRGIERRNRNDTI